MNWMVFPIIAAGIITIGGITNLVLRRLRERRGRRECTEWLCPQCNQKFGGAFRVWRRRSDVGVKSALFNGPVLHCDRCNRDFWFTWTGHSPPSDQMAQAFEVVEQSVA